uniref:Fibronectin type-III domain-containing protein n=1 Tax=Timema bartmani TaxID=61472 RepID=A0A7R9I751_9NEOP|nr:unnamed protein product [Timema bartmani]
MDAHTVDSIYVVWTSSSSLSDCTVAYTVSWCGVTSEWLSEPCNYTSTNVSSDVTWFNITGLDSCSLHRIFVFAVGPGDVKSANTLVFGRTKVEVVPGPVTNITTISVTSTKIMIQWEQPSKSANCIDRYSVCFRNTASGNESNCVTQVSTKKNWWNSDPLQPSTNYTIVVAAIDFDGGRSQNATVTLTTLR